MDRIDVTYLSKNRQYTLDMLDLHTRAPFHTCFARSTRLPHVSSPKNLRSANIFSVVDLTEMTHQLQINDPSHFLTRLELSVASRIEFDQDRLYSEGELSIFTLVCLNFILKRSRLQGTMLQEIGCWQEIISQKRLSNHAKPAHAARAKQNLEAGY